MIDVEREAFERIERQFASGNKADVERAVVRKEDWESAKSYLQATRAQGGQVVEIVSIDPMKCTAVAKWLPDINGVIPKAIDKIGAKLYTHPPTSANQGGVPEGWRVWRDGDEIRVDSPDDAHIALRRIDQAPNHWWGNMFFDLAAALLAAAPSPEQPKPTNRYGVDAPYFHGKLSLVLRDLENYTPDELARALARLVVVADKDVLAEPEFTPEQGQAAAGDVLDLRQQLNQAQADVARLQDALAWSLGKLSFVAPLAGGKLSYIRAFGKASTALSESAVSAQRMRGEVNDD